jgi:O-antigen/teichoic acid export membrane protein
LALVLNFVLNAINDAYVPWLYRNLKAKNTADSPKVANIIAVLMAVLLLGVIGLAPELIHLLAGAQYAEAVWAVGPVAVSVLLLFYSQLFINIQFYYEQKGMLVFASLGAAILNIGLNALMIPRFGFLAAAYTTLASYLVFAGANFWAMRRTLKKQGSKEKLFDMRGLILILAAFAALSAAAMALYDYLVIRLAVAAVFAVVLAFRFRDIGKLMQTFRGNTDT